MNYFAVPVTPTPQTFEIALDGVTYNLTFQFRHLGGGWVLDVADAAGSSIVGGIPIVPGVNLLGQYGYLGFKGGLWVQGATNPDAPPTFDNLGIESRLFWVTTREKP